MTMSKLYDNFAYPGDTIIDSVASWTVISVTAVETGRHMCKILCISHAGRGPVVADIFASEFLKSYPCEIFLRLAHDTTVD
jgi:hypothetical protein